MSGYGYRNALEQSERFEGPYIPESFTFENLLNWQEGISVWRSQDKVFTFQQQNNYLVNDDNAVMRMKTDRIPASPFLNVVDDLSLNPLTVLKHALAAPTLRCLKDSLVQKVPHRRLQFQYKEWPVTISINSNTLLITCVEVQRPYADAFLNVWGDTKKIVHYSFWDLLDNGVHYPRQRDIYFLGNLWESLLITDMAINKPLATDSLRLTPEEKTASRNYAGTMETRIRKMLTLKKEIAKDVWLLPGMCNSTVVKQDDGLLIIEAPNTSVNMELILEQVKEIFPNLPVKSIVSTSDAWLHCGGVRAAAANARVIALRNNQPIIEAILAAQYKTNPDLWQKIKIKKPAIQYIQGRTALPSSSNGLELIPFNTEAGERMMMVYFPSSKLLYASDLLQPGNWQKHYTLEVLQAVKREKLDVQTIYAMHLPVRPFADIISQMKDLE